MNANTKNHEQSLKIVNDNKETKTGNTIFHQVEEYLNEHYEFRFNEIAIDIESKEIDSRKWNSCNENSLWVEVQKQGIKIGQNGLKAVLKSDFVPRYNPLTSYFNSLPKWDGTTDYISQYANYVNLSPSEDKEQYLYHFKKWCVRAVKCVFYDGYFNKQAFVLTDDGKGQNIGKSTWCRNLCPPSLSKYIAEDISNNDKDTRILICKNFLINMDELAALSKKEINQLKSLFSKDQINDRLPYDSKNSIIPRRCSFLGSTNMTTFLHDETGSVRWLCFVIDDINWGYKKEFDVDKLWAQAYALSKDKNFNSELTREDLIKNEMRNDKFQFLSKERESLFKFFEPSDEEFGLFKTTRDMNAHITSNSSIPINEIQLGKAIIASRNYKRTKINGAYGYYVKYKPLK